VAAKNDGNRVLRRLLLRLRPQANDVSIEFDPAAPPAPIELPGENPYPLPRMGERPSYRYKLWESKRRRFDAEDAHGVRDPIWDINDKLRAYYFADRHDVAHPTLFHTYPSIEEVRWDDLPSSFVLKSRHGSSNRGVKALVRVDSEAFRDLLRDRTWTVAEIREHPTVLMICCGCLLFWMRICRKRPILPSWTKKYPI
jgi:hypothetical protein